MAVDSAQYKVTPRSIKWLPAVSYCAEISPQIVIIDSAQYEAARRLTLRSMILSEDSEKLEYLSKNETKNENILNHWSVAQAGSNGEKTRGQKSRWTVPF